MTTLTSPVTGSAQTGLTSPTYTLTADNAPDSNGKQWAVTALGGTQTGVDVNSGPRPFTITITKPKVYKAQGRVNAQGVLTSVPMNTHSVLTRKGVTPLAGQASKTSMIRTSFDVPAGSEVADVEDLRAALSLHIGALTQISAALGDQVATNTI